VWKLEESTAQENGLLYTNLPLRGLGRPADEQVKAVLALIETLPGPVFIHCEHGCDRTGTIVACYRIKHDQWTSTAALDEAKKFGMSKLERGMRRYVLDFAKSFSPATPPPPPKVATASNRS
jgi:protein-tyrosine phosphatase